MNNTVKRGRPSKIKKIILSQARFFGNKSDTQMVEHLIQNTNVLETMKKTTPEKMKKSLYMSVYQVRGQSLAQGKKVAYKGKVINGEVKTKYIRNFGVRG